MLAQSDDGQIIDVSSMNGLDVLTLHALVELDTEQQQDILRRIGLILLSGRFVISSPSNLTRPLVGLLSMRTQRPVVVLPEPLSPTRPSVSPLLILKLTPSTALTSATLR